MNKVIFYDQINDGHHWLYNFNLMKNFKDFGACYYTSLAVDEKEKILNLSENNITLFNNHIVKGSSKRINMFFRNIINIHNLFSYANKNSYSQIHFLYYDIIILQVFLKSIFNRKIKMSATLHWLPKQQIKYKVMKLMLKYSFLEKIIVHGDYIKDKLLDNLGKEYSNKVFSINYPVMENINHYDSTDIEVINDSSGYKKPFLLYFGGTRYDKGLDLLLESLKHVKCDFTLFVVGEEQYFKKIFIEEKIKQLKNKILLRLEYIPEEQVAYYFDIADIVVLPYRRMFSGQSGPLTEAVSHNCVVLGADVGQIGYTIKHFNLGYVFEPENIEAMAHTLSYAITNIENIKPLLFQNQIKYKDLCSPKAFGEKYRELLDFM